MTQDDRIGQRVEIEGDAYPSPAGATVATRDGWYYLGGVSWSHDVIGKRVRATGVLRLQAAQVQDGPDVLEHEHGLADDTLVIENAEWSFLQ
ncbi:MAG: hypothetical protein ACJ780_25390 [Solirubrobacteraceae bacterium]